MTSKLNARSESKTRILDIAERLFSENSFASVSIRNVTSLAHVNLSAVNYYFGSKKDLFHEVYIRRATEMNHERLLLLNDFSSLAEKENRNVTVKELVYALITPPIIWLYDKEQGLSVYIKFLARAYLEKASDMSHVLKEEVDIFDIFIPYFNKSYPDLELNDLYWRIHFTMGAMHHTINHIDRIGLLSNGKCKAENWEKTRDRIVDFCSKGFLKNFSLSE